MRPLLINLAFVFALLMTGCVMPADSIPASSSDYALEGRVVWCEDGVLALRLDNGRIEEVSLPSHSDSIVPRNIHASQGRRCRVQVKNTLQMNEAGERFNAPEITGFQWL